MMKEQVRVFLEFPVSQKMYECVLPCSASFRECMKLLRPLLSGEIGSSYRIDEETCIYEKEHLCRCDMDVPLGSLKAEDGMTFLVL